MNLSIFPDRDGIDEDYLLTIAYADGAGRKLTNTLPIHVIDQDRERTNEFAVTVNYDRDATGFFTNPVARVVVQSAVDDWAYFFAGMNLDPVKRGTETTYIWANNFNGGYTFTNTNDYRGYLLYAYGTTNAAHRSGGEGSFSGGGKRTADRCGESGGAGGDRGGIRGSHPLASHSDQSNARPAV